MVCSEITLPSFLPLLSFQPNFSVFHSEVSLLTVGLSSFPFVRGPFLVTQILGRKENKYPSRLFSVKVRGFLSVFMSKSLNLL
jgi:hypothetical protein